MIDWVTVVLLVAPAFFVQTFWHEAAHAVVAKAQGLDIASFKIWPHKANGDRFYWGRVVYDNPRHCTVSDEGTAIRATAPFAASLFLLSVLASLKLCVEMRLHNVLLTGLDVWIATVGVDLTRGFLQAFTRKERGDINKAREALDWPIPVVRAIAGTGIALVVASVLSLVGPDLLGH